MPFAVKIDFRWLSLDVWEIICAHSSCAPAVSYTHLQLQNNNFGFAPENINAVKDSICLSSSDAGTFYGKTGTGRVDGQDVNGWFIGYIETADNTYFFATNIGADSDATGGNATEITMSILSDMNIWK